MKGNWVGVWLWIFAVGEAFAQNPPRTAPRMFVRLSYGYNFFWGADSLSTTIRGFGSTSPGLTAGARFYFGKFYVAAGAGLQHFEYRFSEPRLPFHDGETFSAPRDETPGRRRQKSKISWFAARLAPELGFTFDKFNLALIGHADFLIHARHKYKYRSDDEGTISRKLIGNRHLHTLIYKAGFTLAADYMGMGIYASWFPTPVFGPDGPRFSSFQAGFSLTAALAQPPYWIRKDRKT
jgi:hypothetical protein